MKNAANLLAPDRLPKIISGMVGQAFRFAWFSRGKSPPFRKLLLAVIFVVPVLVDGCSKKQSHVYSSLKDPAIAVQLKQFVAEKKSQAYAEADKTPPGFDEFFAAAEKGDWLTVSNRLGPLLRAGKLSGPRSAAVREIWGALEAFGAGDEKYSALFGNDIINSIPPGSIYFGGTDEGRFVVTAMEKSQVNGDPFFTLTQNGLADPTYLDYLQSMYGGKIYIPSRADSQNCFDEYTKDAEQRMERHQLKPSENVSRDANGHIQVSGLVAIMEVNGLIAKRIFDKNPDREFYIEESWPLDWMNPYLEPHGLIFKLNHQPLTTLSDDVIERDHDCWTKYANGMIGNWLHDETPVSTITQFAAKVFLQKDFGTSGADRRFVENADAHMWFSKERNSIGDLYLWRAQHASDGVESQRMNDAADFAYRQAFALCPYSPAVVYGYADFLKKQGRISDALQVAEIAAKFKFPGANFLGLVNQLKRQAAK